MEVEFTMSKINWSVLELEKKIYDILSGIDDPDREGLVETPKRYMKFLHEFLNPEPFKMTVFDSEKYDEMIICNGIPFYSLCEHHIAPFFGTASVAYIPQKKIVGLSKLARTVDKFSRRLQNQERMTQQIANFISEHLEPKGVGVIVKARHLCMEMRGIKKSNVYTTTSCVKGVFMEDEKARNEFLRMAK